MVTTRAGHCKFYF